MPSLEKIILKISEGSKTAPEEIKKLIEEKQDELSGLVSPEGAAYIVGRELGVSLLKETKRELKVKNLGKCTRNGQNFGNITRFLVYGGLP